LLAASGALAGSRRALPLIAAELAGYLSAIVPIMLFAAPVIDHVPGALTALKGAACLWLAYCAVKLWRHAPVGPQAGAPVPARRVYITTLLNPKALIFALIILPRAPIADALAGLALFSGLVVAIGAGWVFLGGCLAGGARIRLSRQTVARGTAIVLALFATLLAGSALAALIG
jgi:threonine/homoserine/homoserine lactone efflux protein